MTKSIARAGTDKLEDVGVIASGAAILHASTLPASSQELAASNAAALLIFLCPSRARPQASPGMGPVRGLSSSSPRRCRKTPLDQFRGILASFPNAAATPS